MVKLSKSSDSGMGYVGKIALGLILPILGGFFLGNYLDEKFGTSPLFVLALILLGIISGFAWLYKTAKNNDD
jgi:ATP synthase protein I